MGRALLLAFHAALSIFSAHAFTSLPFGNHAAVLRQPVTRVVMAQTSSRDYDNDLPERTQSRNDSPSQGAKGNRRVEDEEATKFVTGDALHVLRHKVLALRLDLQEARRCGDIERVKELERSILKAQQVDAEFVYTVSMERAAMAEQEGRFQEAQRLHALAAKARSALPQFNLEGLWVGKYGDHGYEMINVTYVGDTLVAKKVTGRKNVPKGEATFQVDLSPRSLAMQDEVLEPIELGESAARQWGSKYLQRFAGKGQVAADGYLDSQWIDGQLILVNEYFSFAWLPIGHQVFFGRPTAELILKLLKDDTKREAGHSSTRAYLERCWEETEHIQDDIEVSEGSFSSTNTDYYNQEGCFE